MPSPAAMERGAAIAGAILDDHKAKHNGAYPETVAVALWGLDAIKTKGESVGILLTLVRPPAFQPRANNTNNNTNSAPPRAASWCTLP
eukprot:4372307-Pyramimonas_sp.AAC.1